MSLQKKSGKKVKKSKKKQKKRASQAQILRSHKTIKLPAKRLELLHPCEQQILSLSCLPFHHAGNLFLEYHSTKKK